MGMILVVMEKVDDQERRETAPEKHLWVDESPERLEAAGGRMVVS